MALHGGDVPRIPYFGPEKYMVYLILAVADLRVYVSIAFDRVRAPY